MATFGQLFKDRRIELGLTLREFCQKYGLDPGNMSKTERGVLLPPQDNRRLEEWAAYLQIQKGSALWHDFFDTAHAERGNIPPDLLRDKEVIGKLPVLFRALRGQKISREAILKLIEKIRRA